MQNPYTSEENQKRVFIASQGPIPVSFNNFWRMVWQENVETIVMLCGINENGRIMCDVYWPENEKKLLYDY